MKIAQSVFFFAVSAFIILFYAVGTSYEVDTTSMLSRYGVVQDVHMMLFPGFAFLMCFAYKSGLTASGYTLLLGSLAVLWGILMRGLFVPAVEDKKVFTIHVGLAEILYGDFCAVAVMISFGAVLGRLSAVQLMIMTLVECAFYAMNEGIVFGRLHTVDVGGSSVIHLFGAVFGLSVSFVVGKMHDHISKDRTKNKSSRTSDTIAMIGTLILFCFWPSFVSAIAGLSDAGTRQRVMVNTYLSLFGSVLGAFATVQLFHADGKFRMVEVQNSTLAAGVAFGALGDMAVSPAGAVGIGFVAAVISVVGYQVLSPWLEEKIGLIDTCGILNLHCTPAILGMILSAIVTAKASEDVYNGKKGEVFSKLVDTKDSSGNITALARSPTEQAGYQLAGLGVTIALALGGGLLTGLLISLPAPLEVMYDDEAEWDDVEDEDGHHAAATTDDGFTNLSSAHHHKGGLVSPERTHPDDDDARSYVSDTMSVRSLTDVPMMPQGASGAGAGGAAESQGGAAADQAAIYDTMQVNE